MPISPLCCQPQPAPKKLFRRILYSNRFFSRSGMATWVGWGERTVLGRIMIASKQTLDCIGGREDRAASVSCFSTFLPLTAVSQPMKIFFRGSPNSLSGTYVLHEGEQSFNALLVHQKHRLGLGCSGAKDESTTPFSQQDHVSARFPSSCCTNLLGGPKHCLE